MLRLLPSCLTSPFNFCSSQELCSMLNLLGRRALFLVYLVQHNQAHFLTLTCCPSVLSVFEMCASVPPPVLQLLPAAGTQQVCLPAVVTVL